MKLVNHSKQLYEWNTVKDTRYILSFNDNEQLMLVIQNTHEVKQRACPHLQRRLVYVTWPDKWSHNMMLTFLVCDRLVMVVMGASTWQVFLQTNLPDQTEGTVATEVTLFSEPPKTLRRSITSGAFKPRLRSVWSKGRRDYGMAPFVTISLHRYRHTNVTNGC